MPTNTLPWTQMNDFLIKVGNVREPKALCVQIVQDIYTLIPYDQARIYFIDSTGKVYDEVLIGVEKRWSEVYLEYYSKYENGRYAIPTRSLSIPAIWSDRRHSLPKLEGGVYDWTKYPTSNKFIAEYIKPQGLKYSAGFGLHSADNITKSVYVLDRTSSSGYSTKEIEILKRVQPNLDNLHKNLFVRTMQPLAIQNPELAEMLTNRELEVAEYLCKGLTPVRISNMLSVSQSTVYRHIANIHTKLNVSNRQELILKLLRTQH